jgi:sialic acid synthase SpsE/sugar phosphate isomerase/epimerase
MNAKYLSILNRKVGPGYPSFIIAEIGNNHNGDIKLAKHLVDLAIESGCDAVKFQLRNMVALYGKLDDEQRSKADLSTQYTLDLLSKFQLSVLELESVFQYARQKGIIPFCTPWDAPSVDVLEKMDCAVYKVASADLTNHPLLQHLAQTGKPLICSTGMSRSPEIELGAKVLSLAKGGYAFLHCNSTYPTPFKDVHLRFMDSLRVHSHVVGYSGHERGYHVCLGALALGANIIEKHFTIDKKMEGNDHKVSLLPHEMKDFIVQARELEAAMGEANQPRQMSQGEMMNRENLAKSLVATQAIALGQVIETNMVGIISPGQGLPPYRMADVLGQKAKRAMDPGEFFFESDIVAAQELRNSSSFQFSRPWGIPVRYHDAEKLIAEFKPNLIEFHLSYQDMEEDLKRFFTKVHPDIDFVVHAPELFAGDTLLDLCSSDLAYRNNCISNIQKVCDISNELKKYFPKTNKPAIVINAGGFTADAPLPEADRKPLYEIIYQSLQRINAAGTEIIPQTMAPFPWHFGGQQYQNLFKFPEEIDWFCKTYGYRMCLDYSHSHLVCNHHKYTMEEFMRLVAPHTIHFHLGDASGVDGEGLQVGDGEIDFPKLGSLMKKYSPKASFIPEIWQGHKNGGEGFWGAFHKLSGLI